MPGVGVARVAENAECSVGSGQRTAGQSPSNPFSQRERARALAVEAEARVEVAHADRACGWFLAAMRATLTGTASDRPQTRRPVTARTVPRASGACTGGGSTPPDPRAGPPGVVEPEVGHHPCDARRTATVVRSRSAAPTTRTDRATPAPNPRAGREPEARVNVTSSIGRPRRARQRRLNGTAACFRPSRGERHGSTARRANATAPPEPMRDRLVVNAAREWAREHAPSLLEEPPL
jgi:hypothetical protein